MAKRRTHITRVITRRCFPDENELTGGREKSMAEQVTRREIKFRMPLLAYKRVESQLQAQLEADPHNVGGGYTVTSLYFDSIDDDDQWNVLYGLETRKKIRLRVYSPQDQRAKFEYKHKCGAEQTKYSLTVSRREARALMDGDYTCLLGSTEPIGLTMYTEMNMRVYRPKVLIAYERQAFIYPVSRVRITYDANIRASQTDLDPFMTDVQWMPVMEPGVGILEVKYDGFLPSFIRSLLREVDDLPQANSKYLQGRGQCME